MTKAERTRNYIIEKTARLFNIKGYGHTTLSDITAGTGLTKGSIYGNFENREAVMVAAYEYNIKGLHQMIEQAIATQHEPKDKLIAMVQTFKKQWPYLDKMGGCPIQNAAIEADDHLACMQKSVQFGFRHWAAQIITIIKAGIAQGQFKKVNPEKYAYLIIAQLEGAILLSKTFRHPKYLYQAITHITCVIDKEILLKRQANRQEAFLLTKLFNIHHEKSSYNRLRRYYTTGQYRRVVLGKYTERKKRSRSHHKI